MLILRPEWRVVRKFAEVQNSERVPGRLKSDAGFRTVAQCRTSRRYRGQLDNGQFRGTHVLIRDAGSCQLVGHPPEYGLDTSGPPAAAGPGQIGGKRRMTSRVIFDISMPAEEPRR
jgi:hypothetical protein